MTQQTVTVALIGLAGSCGALARFGITRIFGMWTTLPLGTLVINVSGAFLLGLFAAWAQKRGQVSEMTILAVTTGFLGAYTTFSTFMWETQGMLQSGQWWRGTGYLVGSVVLGLVAVRLGVMVAGSR